MSRNPPPRLPNGRTTPEYNAWVRMRGRCNSPAHHRYRYYGARGIRVCDRWASFHAFLEDMGPRPSPRHSIDRINNDGHYEPSNCRWALPVTQARNSRSAHVVEHDGKRMCLEGWAEITGIKAATIRFRLRRGYPVARALNAAAIKRNEA